MSTVVVFTGADGDGPLSVAVEASPADVREAFAASNGLPFVLDSAKGEVSRVYINPVNVAH